MYSKPSPEPGIRRPASYQAGQGGQKPAEKGNREKAKWILDDDSEEPKTARQIIASCIQLDETVVENKIVYFMFNVGAAGAMPYLSMYSLQLGLPFWHIGLIVGAGLLVGDTHHHPVGIFRGQTPLASGHIPNCCLPVDCFHFGGCVLPAAGSSALRGGQEPATGSAFRRLSEHGVHTQEPCNRLL